MDNMKKMGNEIDVFSLVIDILKDKKTILKFCSVGFVVGIIVAFCTPKTYTSEVVLAPELSSGGLGLTGNIAEMASSFGFDVGKKSSMDAIYPELYPDIFSSSDFILKLFDVPVRLKDEDELRSYVQHLCNDIKHPFWTLPKAWIIKMLEKPETVANGKAVKDPYRLSKVDSDLCSAIAGSIGCLVDKKTSEITITFTDQDPMVACIMADTLQRRLQAYITDYRTQKTRIDLAYYKKLTDESKANYEKARREYAKFCDSNFDIELETFKSRRDQLENEMQMQYNVYSQMATQLQNAKAKVQENTPAFTMIQSPVMPYKASSRPRVFTVIIFIFLSFILYLTRFAYLNILKNK